MARVCLERADWLPPTVVNRLAAVSAINRAAFASIELDVGKPVRNGNRAVFSGHEPAAVDALDVHVAQAKRHGLGGPSGPRPV